VPFDPDNKKDFSRLQNSIKYAREQMKPFLAFAMKAKRQMVGPHYGHTSKNEHDRVPVNGMEELASVLSMAIAAKNPQVMVSTYVEGLVSQARRFEQRLNKLIREINLAATLRGAIVNAVFGPGVVRIGVEADRRNRIGGYMHNVGQPFVDNIHHANLVWDMSPDARELMDFMGDKYRRPVEHFENNPLYDQNAVDQLRSGTFGAKDDTGIDREQTLSLGEGQYEERFRKRVDAYHMWLPGDDLIVTMSLNAEKPLRIVPFDGPEGGPYRVLSFQDVPGQLWPLAPAYTLWDLNDFVNRIYRKIFRQGEREKEVFTYQGDSEDTFRRVFDAVDGEGIRSDTVDPVQRVKIGGASPQTIAMAIHAHGLFKRRSGMDIIAGFGQVADTATQEKIVKSSTDERVEAMQDRFAEFAEGIVQACAWYEWTEELREEVVYRRISETDYYLEELWSPETREGDLVQHDIRIVPFSMRRQTPAEKVQLMFAMWDRTMQAAPMLAAQNIAPDFDGFYNGISRLTNFPELREMVRFKPSEMDLQGITAPMPAGAPQPFGQQARGSAQPQGGGSADSLDETQLMSRLLSGAGQANTVGGAS
jgi:hypothetical protein